MSKRRIFETHGVIFSGESGDQLIGNCPFTNKDNKFYVNQRTWLWDSKTAGLSGNIAHFLRHIAQQYVGQLTPQKLAALARDRRLPEEAFKGWDIGWDGSSYTIPVRDAAGHVVDIRMYRLGKPRVMSTAGASVGLLGADTLAYAPSSPIYICEGEWDAIAAAYMLKKSKTPGLVVAVPGAGTFKGEWVPWLTGRLIHTLYDHDAAGEAGERTAADKLRTAVQKITYVHWPMEMPSGFDVRDWVVAHATEGMAAAARKLHLLFRDTPKSGMAKEPPVSEDDAHRARTATPAAPPPTFTDATAPDASDPDRWPTPPTLDDVMTTFRRWLHLDNVDSIMVMLGCVVSQTMDGPPVWVFLVGPPGSAKTAVLASLNTYEKIYSTSSLTVHALISGANWKETMYPSLIPKLDGKIMVVKDFTSIMAMRDAEKDEIFGILRDAYDGRCGKVFGNGVTRNYVSRFTVLAAVTPRIYDLSSNHTSLGERFLKFSVGHNLIHTSEEEIISRAIGNINSESEMNAEFQSVVNNFLTRTVDMAHIPDVPKPIERRIIALAMWGARMRGSVTRDTYRNEIITSRPSAEIGSRLGIQLAKLGKALAMVNGRRTVGMEEYRLLKKITLDTIPQRNEDVFRHMLRLCPTTKDTVSASTIATATRYPVATVQRLLQDMDVLDIVTKTGSSVKFNWTLSNYIRECASRAGLYVTEEEKSRPTRVWVKRKSASKRPK